ncbi:MAG: Crp/Fnr family transcriptional regulator [Oscillospiraceae bacterium]|nr:Crp/Fnr family transcriptional regulator [Oscillospiraceae bacterium]
MPFSCAELFAQSFPFWEKLSDDEKKTLCVQTSFAEYSKGQNIHGNTGNCTGALLVKSGILRAYILSDGGKEITLYRLYPGDICMLSASCVMQSITFDVYVDAEVKSEVYIINSGAFAKQMEENVFVENFALKMATERFSEVMWAMQQILFMSFDRRLAVFLIDELAKDGGDTIKLTQEQIAKYMGSAREVVSRMLKYFSTEGLVEVSRGGVRVLDKTRLKTIAATEGA